MRQRPSGVGGAALTPMFFADDALAHRDQRSVGDRDQMKMIDDDDGGSACLIAVR
ncbi:hypothetical protein OHB15_49565 [Streptosporangium subroseum]|nr:hypothetical protein OHB15_49565 [Streptosporangium subroseum]